MLNKLDEQYQQLLGDIIQNGVVKSDRTEVGTVSVFGRTIRHSMKEGFPILTSKKMHIKGIIYEMLWFLNGDTNIKYLIDRGVNIWNGDCWKNYQKKTEKSDNAYETQEEFINAILKDPTFAKIWGELGPIYGKQWVKWGERRNVWSNHNDYTEGINQILNLVNDLKTNPDSRRLIVNAWNVADVGHEDLRNETQLYEDYLKNNI